jgi:hypothetical protein
MINGIGASTLCKFLSGRYAAPDSIRFLQLARSKPTNISSTSSNLHLLSKSVH